MEGGPSRIIGKRFFVLDLVRHVTATDAPLSGGLAGCKMSSFQRPRRGSAASGYRVTYWDTESHIGISKDRLAYAEIEKDISWDILTILR